MFSLFQPGQKPAHPNIVVTSYPDGVPHLQLPQPGSTAPAPGHLPPPIQSTADGRTLSPTSPGANRKGGKQGSDLFKKPDIGKFEAVTGAKCFICRLSIPPGSKDFPSRQTNTVTCSRCKKVAFGGQKKTIEPIPKFPTACNAPLAEKMSKLRKAQALVRMKHKIARQRAMGLRPGGKVASASAPSSPAPRSPMPPSPASLPPKSPGSFMPHSPIPSSNSLPPPSPGYMPTSPGCMPPSPASLPPRSPGNYGPPKSPSSHPRSPHGFQPKSPMSLPPRSPCSSMPPSPQPGYHSYPASPSGGFPGGRPPMSPGFAPRQPSPGGSAASGHGSSPEKQAEGLTPGGRHPLPSVASPRHPQIHEQSPASSTSSERLSLPPGREQDDTTIRALLQLGRQTDKPRPGDAREVPVMVLQRGEHAQTSGARVPHIPQPLIVPSSGEHTTSSLPSTPTMLSAGGHLIPVVGTPTSTTSLLPPGYPTAALPFLVQSFSPGGVRPPGADKVSPVPKGVRSMKPGFPPGHPQYIPSQRNSSASKQPHYADGKYVVEPSDNRPDSIVIVGTNCAGSSSITVGNDLKDGYIQVPPSLQVPKQQLTEMYGKPGFTAFYCSCSGRQIMLLQCPDCDFVCNNLFGMELHIAAQRHAESRAKAAATDVLGNKYGNEQESSSHQYENDREMHDDSRDEIMSQSSVDTQSADLDIDAPSPRNPREASFLFLCGNFSVIHYHLELSNRHRKVRREFGACNIIPIVGFR